MWKFFLGDDYVLIGLKIDEEIGPQQSIVGTIIIDSELTDLICLESTDHLGEKGISIHKPFIYSGYSYEFQPVSKILKNFIEILFIFLVFYGQVVVIVEIFRELFEFLFEPDILFDFIFLLNLQLLYGLLKLLYLLIFH